MPTTLAAFDCLGLGISLGTLLILLSLETLSPLRERVEARLPRLTRNLVFAIIGGLIVRTMVVTTVLAAAALSHEHGFGLLAVLPLPAQAALPLGLLLLDASMYGWHRLNHAVPFLWRFHQVHHVDRDLDTSTALRFHPGELVLSVPFRALQALVLAPWPALALGHELATQVATAFHHANVRLPPRLERGVNLLLVTPRMHQIHHSIERHETDSNWSVIFSFWDRLARSYRSGTAEQQLVIGVPAYSAPADVTLGKLLGMPFAAQRSWSGDRAAARSSEA
ncbi:MAG TPA: sterol desaturase family protein [Polyangiales bacterium]|nr:sterol desaturase family protein [Polyangiales bacterium]